jgi:hypothetical protein
MNTYTKFTVILIVVFFPVCGNNNDTEFTKLLIYYTDLDIMTYHTWSCEDLISNTDYDSILITDKDKISKLASLLNSIELIAIREAERIDTRICCQFYINDRIGKTISLSNTPVMQIDDVVYRRNNLLFKKNYQSSAL